MSRPALRFWIAAHKWTSLLCAVFLLILCLTGLPLLFKEQIADWLDDGLPFADLAPDASRTSLDRIVDISRSRYPGEAMLSVFVDDDEPQIIVSLAESWEVFRNNNNARHIIKFDARTGQILKETKPYDGAAPPFLLLVYNLHKELFAGLPGQLVVGIVGLAFVISVISGVILYAPFMRRLDFGRIRAGNSVRLVWLDLHNLIGIVATVWLCVVGSTGILNALSTPLFGYWQNTDIAALIAPLRNRPVPADAELNSLQAAFDTARKVAPDMTATSVIFPGSPFGTPHHYVIWMKGNEPFTSRLFSPVLIDARTGEVDQVVSMPWYLRALEMSRPFHFGDYGGIPLKLIWALFDLATIVVLVTGIYLWRDRSRGSRAIS